MNNSMSLRGRLTVVILAPLIVLAMLFGSWAYFDAQDNAAERFDRSLLSTALAISRDIAVNGGDALSEETRDLLRDTSGGAVFYHVYAPDGVFVTGYATPPVPPEPVLPETTQTYFDAVYQGAPVRALRFSQSTTIDGLTGFFTFSVWQQTSVRDGFVETRTGPVFGIITSMIIALAFIVWFGVARGLAPLTDLEDAIARRSATDLSPIKRRIPQEVTGIVGQFNALIGELSKTLEAKNAFISDAAHQLRNPIAGVLSLAESVASARTIADVKERTDDLLDAAKGAGLLANNLLTLERAQATLSQDQQHWFDPRPILHGVVRVNTPAALDRNVQLLSDLSTDMVRLRGDPLMFEQALLNIIRNALLHGGPNLTQINLTANIIDQCYNIKITDNGKGIAETDFDHALGRFRQVGPSPGSGLGLPIAATVAEAMGGELFLTTKKEAFSVNLLLPCQPVSEQ